MSNDNKGVTTRGLYLRVGNGKGEGVDPVLKSSSTGGLWKKRAVVICKYVTRIISTKPSFH